MECKSPFLFRLPRSLLQSPGSNRDGDVQPKQASQLVFYLPVRAELFANDSYLQFPR